MFRRPRFLVLGGSFLALLVLACGGPDGGSPGNCQVLNVPNGHRTECTTGTSDGTAAATQAAGDGTAGPTTGDGNTTCYLLADGMQCDAPPVCDPGTHLDGLACVSGTGTQDGTG